MVNGKRDAGQFCFSSEALYRAYEQFVIDQYGDGSDGVTTRFAVVPNDNRLVCQCAACKAKGNTPQSATPAVTALIERLARRFPHQMFFTSAYSTTRTAPTHRLPDNVGVMVSAIDMPMAPEASQAKGHETLEAQIKAWQKCCSRVYVWDYMRNFDDYLTPYPCLHHMQSRLRFYRDLGVKGVFLNGSGYDYAPFDDVQTYVLAQLLINPDVDIEACASRYFASAYPKTGQLLGDYYRKIEQQAQRATLPFYGGIDEALGTWLDAQQFGEFFSSMDKASKQADEAERSKLNHLLTALAFTRLEIMRSQKQAPSRQQIDAMTSLLAHHTAFEDMANYRESDGDLDGYLKQWKESYPWLDTANDLLRGANIDAEPKADTHLLSDGKQGFATDYHLGWLITSAPVQRFSVSSGLPSTAVFHVSLLHAPQWHIFAPSSIEVVQGGAVKGKAIITSPTDSRRVRVSISATGLQPGVKTEVIITQTAAADIYKASRVLLPLVIIGMTAVMETACTKRVRPTYITVADSIRHYYPVVSGEVLDLTYVVRNEGDDPFLIDDIQPSCGCIDAPKDIDAIPPHDSITLKFSFDTTKNIGYVRHSIRLFGNVLPRGMAVLTFDVNVVPPSFDQPDYEEVHSQRRANNVEELVDGKSSEKGYYTAPDASRDSRQHVKYPWRD